MYNCILAYRYIDHVIVAECSNCHGTKETGSKACRRGCLTLSVLLMLRVVSAELARERDSIDNERHQEELRQIQQEEDAINGKMGLAKKRPQIYYGIPIHHISPSSWESAIYHLSNIDSFTLPCDKLDALLAAAKEIPALYLQEHPVSFQLHSRTRARRLMKVFLNAWLLVYLYFCTAAFVAIRVW